MLSREDGVLLPPPRACPALRPPAPVLVRPITLTSFAVPAGQLANVPLKAAQPQGLARSGQGGRRSPRWVDTLVENPLDVRRVSLRSKTSITVRGAPGRRDRDSSAVNGAGRRWNQRQSRPGQGRDRVADKFVLRRPGWRRP